jgi:formylglycine-generating enzyme required for sulfatase activity/antitoxin component YwqK of YwqJK toxin-antitoxin module
MTALPNTFPKKQIPSSSSKRQKEAYTMKIKTIAQKGIAVLAASSFALTACGETKEGKNSGGDKPKDEQAKSKRPISNLDRKPGEVRSIDLGEGIKLEMLWIPLGSFQMGSPDNEEGREENEGPVHKVTISKGFWLGKYEITQEQYLAVEGSNPSNFQSPEDTSRPVEKVSWINAVEYCAALTESAQTAGRCPATWSYRLPTEAEWEYAARAGTATRFSHGNDPGYTSLTNYAWYSSNSGNTTHPVGLKAPNAWGLFDMHGNVWEWCQDSWDARDDDKDANYPVGTTIDPLVVTASPYRVMRGGSIVEDKHCRCASRIRNPLNFSCEFFGFRIVLAPDKLASPAPEPVRVITADKLESKNRIVYEVDQETPFTGQVQEKLRNGQKSTNYKDGLRHGVQTRWHKDGQKLNDSNYKDGQKHGVQTYWYDNGQKRSETNYKDGQRHGESTRWQENGQKESEGNYKYEEPDGVHTEWHENGELYKEVNYKDGNRHGLETYWDESGQKKEETNYKDDYSHGAQTYWYENGQKKSVKNIKWLDGLHGVQTEWHENGQKKLEENYTDDEKDGVQTTWDENGKKTSEARYENGVKKD